MSTLPGQYDCCTCWHTGVSFSLAAKAVKPQQQGVLQTTGCLVTLHRVCWCLCYCSFNHQPGLVRACRAPTRHLRIWDSFELSGQENTTLTLVLFLFLLCFHVPYSKACTLKCCGLECLRWKAMSLAWKKSCLLCVLKGGNHDPMWLNLWCKKALKWGNGKKHIQITNENLFLVQTYKPSTN